MDYRFVVVERYRDGGTWKHFYMSGEYARLCATEMQEAHPGRTYEVLEVRP